MGPVGVPRDRKQDTHVSERQRDNAPTFDHSIFASATTSRAAKMQPEQTVAIPSPDSRIVIDGRENVQPPADSR
jgi:hypothetical protein